MAYIILITSKKETPFLANTKTIIESHQYSETNKNTYIGTKPSSTIVAQLKNGSSYKSDKTKCGIEIYHGNVSKV